MGIVFLARDVALNRSVSFALNLRRRSPLSRGVASRAMTTLGGRTSGHRNLSGQFRATYATIPTFTVFESAVQSTL